MQQNYKVGELTTVYLS